MSVTDTQDENKFDMIAVVFKSSSKAELFTIDSFPIFLSNQHEQWQVEKEILKKPRIWMFYPHGTSDSHLKAKMLKNKFHGCWQSHGGYSVTGRSLRIHSQQSGWFCTKNATFIDSRKSNGWWGHSGSGIPWSK